MWSAVRRGFSVFLVSLASMTLTTQTVQAETINPEGYWQGATEPGLVVKIQRSTPNSFLAYIVQQPRTDACYAGPGHLGFELSETGGSFTGRLEWWTQPSCQRRFATLTKAAFGQNGALSICSNNPFPGGNPPSACSAWKRTHDCSSPLGCELTASFAFVAAIAGGLVGSVLLVPGLFGPKASRPVIPKSPDKAVDLEMAGIEAVEGQEAGLESAVPVVAALESAVSSATQNALAESAGACNRFGFDLLNKLLEGSSSNVCLSPLGAAIALALTAEAAGGDARLAIASVLGIRPEDLRETLNRLRDTLRVSPTQLELATALWIGTGISPSAEFIEFARERYGAQIQGIDFSAPSSRAELDRWVNEATHGKIQTFAASFSPEAAFVLASAADFQGVWERAFDSEPTKDRSFRTGVGQKSIPFMRRIGRMRYARDEQFQLASLDYTGSRYRLKVLLPNQLISPGLLKDFGLAQVWEQLSTRAEELEGSLAMPRVRVAQELRLEHALSELGMSAAFDAQADFSRLSPDCTGRCYLSEVRQACKLEIVEAGSTAAAVTSIDVAASAVPTPSEPFEMVIDRPFFLGLEDASSGALIFLAAVFDPEAVSSP